MARSKTIPVRVDRKLVDLLKVRFPDVRTPDLFNMMYRTSILRFEGALRKKKIK